MNLNEHSKYLMGRFDHYSESVNNKGNFFLAFNTFVIGAIAAGHQQLLEIAVENNMETLVRFGLVAMVVISFLSMLFIFSAMIPYLRSGNKKPDYHSLIFFKSIAKLTQSDFEEQYINQTEENIKIDLTKQMYQLSKGLHKKYFRLKIAGLLVFAMLTIFTMIIFILILN